MATNLNLVGYCSSSEESDRDHNDQHESQGRKRKRPSPRVEEKPKKINQLPPIPAALLDMYASNVRISQQDDPSLHGGRKRTVPHVEGMWPTHIYLEWLPSATERDQLVRLHKQVAPHAKSLLLSESMAAQPLHISLSTSLQIPTEGKGTFLEEISHALGHIMREPKYGPNSVDLNRTPRHVFTITFSDLIWAANGLNTRWFLALTAQQPKQDELNKLLNASNSVARARRLPMLYEDNGTLADLPSLPRKKLKLWSAEETSEEVVTSIHRTNDRTGRFHISLAWTLDNPIADKRKKIRSVRAEGPAMDEALKLKISFESVKVKIGNIVHNVPIQGADKGRGLVG